MIKVKNWAREVVTKEHRIETLNKLVKEIEQQQCHKPFKDRAREYADDAIKRAGDKEVGWNSFAGAVDEIATIWVNIVANR